MGCWIFWIRRICIHVVMYGQTRKGSMAFISTACLHENDAFVVSRLFFFFLYISETTIPTMPRRSYDSCVFGHVTLTLLSRYSVSLSGRATGSKLKTPHFSPESSITLQTAEHTALKTHPGLCFSQFTCSLGFEQDLHVRLLDPQPQRLPRQASLFTVCASVLTPRLGGSSSATEAAWARGTASLRSWKRYRRKKGWTTSLATCFSLDVTANGAWLSEWTVSGVLFVLSVRPLTC